MPRLLKGENIKRPGELFLRGAAGEQEQSAYNGYFGSVCYHPLFLFNRQGDCLAAKLRPGNEVRLWLSVLAYNLGNPWRRLKLWDREVSAQLLGKG